MLKEYLQTSNDPENNMFDKCFHNLDSHMLRSSHPSCFKYFRGKHSVILLLQVPITVHYDHGTSKSDLLEALEMVWKKKMHCFLKLAVPKWHMHISLTMNDE